LPPGVETPGYYPPSLQDGKSPIGATNNSPAIYCRVAGTMIKAIIREAVMVKKRKLGRCMLLVAEEMAQNFTADPLYVIGMGQGSGRGLHACKDLTYFEATRYAAKEAYGMSDLKPDDIQYKMSWVRYGMDRAEGRRKTGGFHLHIRGTSRHGRPGV